jgi:acetylornithine deacetylase/succinyl-diaminopimelate desuccinylase-like protein
VADLLEELLDWLRIPSVSAGARDEAALRAAAEWARERVLRAGGTCELVEMPGGAPLVVGELRSARAGAPTVMIYGHYDVQDPGSLAEWTTPPFEPAIRDERIYARGAADDKGNFLPLLHEACALAAAGDLPVHVRVLVEGAEETGDEGVLDWVRADERGADCVIVFDTDMVDPDTPALTLATRGMVFAEVEVRTGARPGHSGVYGGSALNAFHALHRALAAVLAGRDGRLPEPLRAGVAAPAPDELASWAALPAGAELLAAGGLRPADPAAEEEFYVRTGAAPSLDVHWVSGGEIRTIVVERASAALSVRLAAGQRPREISATLERLLREALPDGAELTYSAMLAEPSLFDPDLPALQAARRALAQVEGREPALVRSGGTLPVLGAFAERGIPAIVSGFAVAGDNVHAPDEWFRLAALEQGARAARALYGELAALSSG